MLKKKKKKKTDKLDNRSGGQNWSLHAVVLYIIIVHVLRLC